MSEKRAKIGWFRGIFMCVFGTIFTLAGLGALGHYTEWGRQQVATVVNNVVTTNFVNDAGFQKAVLDSMAPDIRFRGEQGPRGEQGIRGNLGEPGPKGEDGASPNAEDVARAIVEDSAVSGQLLTLLADDSRFKGEPGVAGAPGAPGTSGAPGAAGSPGSQGPVGPAGLEGPAGDKIPVGTLAATWRETAPVGWLICDGRSIPEAFEELREIVGGDSTPDLTGLIPGASEGGDDNPLAGAVKVIIKY